MALGAWAAASSSGARAQEAGKPKLVAQLGQASPKLGVAFLATVKQNLRELGWIEGRNIAYEYRAADATPSVCRDWHARSLRSGPT